MQLEYMICPESEKIITGNSFWLGLGRDMLTFAHA